MTMGELWRRLQFLLHRERFREELEEEMRAHQARRAEMHQAGGMTPGDASAAARREFGNAGLIQETSRDAWGGRMLDDLGEDVRYALRTLAQNPVVTLTAALTLGLGMGANTAMFGVVDRLFLRPLPHVVHPERLVDLSVLGSWNGNPSYSWVMQTYPRYLDLKAHARTVSVAAYGPWAPTFSLGLGEHAEPVTGRMVTASYFPLLGVHPVLGRFFTEDEDQLAHPTFVTVLSEEFWKSHFGSDSSVLGSTIHLGRDPYTIVGVAPTGFGGVDLEVPDLWLPLTAAAPRIMGPTGLTAYYSWMTGVARLAPGATPEQAGAEVTGIYRSWAALTLDSTGVVVARPLHEALLQSRSIEMTALPLWLTGAAGIVLLIACANVANLLLARAVQRRREIAVRLALGATRARLARMLLTESLVLALMGGGAAIGMAELVGPILRATFLPHVSGNSIDTRNIGFAAAGVLVTALLAGLAPALQSIVPDLTAALKSGARQGAPGRSRMRSTLLVVQVALTLVLLTGAGLFIESLRHARAVPLGFDADQIISVSVDLHALGYRPADVRATYGAMENALGGLPRVAATSLVSGTVFGFGQGTVVHIPGRDSIQLPESGSPMISAVTPEYFHTLGTRIIRGRGLSDADRSGAPAVAVINQRMAAHYWPGVDPVGRCLRIMGDKGCTTVVGVSGDAALYTMMESGEMQFYVPMNQLSLHDSSFGSWRSEALLIRADGNPGSLITAVRQAIQRTSPDLPYADISVVASRFDRALRPWQLGSVLLGILGGLGLLLAAVGLYGVLSYLVSQRTQELGIRVALGADRRALLRMVVGQGTRVALVGVGIGIVGALASGRTIAALLYGVSPTDPLVLSAVAAVVIVVAVIASYLPARRATRVDPMTALRYE